MNTLDGEIHWRFDTYLEADNGWIYSLDRMSDVTGDTSSWSVVIP